MSYQRWGYQVQELFENRPKHEADYCPIGESLEPKGSWSSVVFLAMVLFTRKNRRNMLEMSGKSFGRRALVGLCHDVRSYFGSDVS
jgi:hypothetical protein